MNIFTFELVTVKNIIYSWLQLQSHRHTSTTPYYNYYNYYYHYYCYYSWDYDDYYYYYYHYYCYYYYYYYYSYYDDYYSSYYHSYYYYIYCQYYYDYVLPLLRLWLLPGGRRDNENIGRRADEPWLCCVCQVRLP